MCPGLYLYQKLMKMPLAQRWAKAICAIFSFGPTLGHRHWDSHSLFLLRYSLNKSVLAQRWAWGIAGRLNQIGGIAEEVNNMFPFWKNFHPIRQFDIWGTSELEKRTLKFEFVRLTNFFRVQKWAISEDFLQMNWM